MKLYLLVAENFIYIKLKKKPIYANYVCCRCWFSPRFRCGWAPPRCPLCIQQSSPRERCPSRAPDRSDCYLGTAGIPRYCLHPPHLGLLGVLRRHVQGRDPPRVLARGHAELLLPGLCQVCHWTQAWVLARTQVILSTLADTSYTSEFMSRNHLLEGKCTWQ